MNHEWRKDRRPNFPIAATLLPPPTVDETGWDILLALHADTACDLSLQKLRSIVSASEATVVWWLAKLEESKLITGVTHAQDLRAVLTTTGRELLDRYLSATSDLQLGAHH